MKALDALILGAGQLRISSNDLSPVLVSGEPTTCPINSPISCQTSKSIFSKADSCCINAPGGQFAQTQFWNSDSKRGPPGYLGPANSWTIHGLWPDHCDGRYDSVCDCARSGDCSSRNRKCKDTCSRDYSNVSNILRKFGDDDLLAYMNQYWKGIEGDENLHQHEWSKHGTCINTLEPKCYENYISAQEVVDYFRVATDLFKTLPTYQWLKQAGITPSTDKTYNRADIEAALEIRRGVSPVLGCEGGELREVWYFFNVRGSLQSGSFVASNPDFSGTGGKAGASCPSKVNYLPKT